MKKPDVNDFIGQSFKEYSIALDVYSDQLEAEKKELIEIAEQMKDNIINAFREGRKTGAIFKTQKDREGLAERYLRDLTINKLKQ